VDGYEALQRLLTQKIHPVLLDWNIPRPLGIGFLKKVRNIDAIDAGATDQGKNKPETFVSISMVREPAVRLRGYAWGLILYNCPRALPQKRVSG
jgi:CheY-like chemotaxis protein